MVPVPDNPLPVRVIDDAETLRALSDPLRLAILRELIRDSDVGSPVVLSAKELAERLGEPQTKLYRHLKVLQERGLIAVAETRVVSGITEQRYRTGQLRLDFDNRLLGDRASEEDESAFVGAAFDDYRKDYVGAVRSGRVVMGIQPPRGEAYRRPTLSTMEVRLPADGANEFRRRLDALLDEIAEASSDPDGVLVRLFFAWYSPPE
jgi:DNA-binding transcriptional ArsR family regulator